MKHCHQVRELLQVLDLDTILGQERQGLCFISSIYIQLYLRLFGEHPEIIKGNFSNAQRSHYWIKLANSDIIVDPTISQFGSDYSHYLVIEGSNEILQLYTPHNNYNQNIFEQELNELMGWYRRHYPIPSEPQFDFYRRMILVGLKLAIKVQLIRKGIHGDLDETTRRMYAQYLEPVHTFVNNRRNGIRIFDYDESSIPDYEQLYNLNI